MEDEDRLDIAYWLSQTPQERISALTNLHRTYFKWLNGSFPTKMEKVVSRRKMDVSRMIIRIYL